MASLSFPTSSTPGGIPGQGSGRLVNARTIKLGADVVWGPAPGLDLVASPGVGSPRGGLLVGDALLLARAGSLYALDASYSLRRIGTLPGTQPVTMARDNYAALAGDPQAIAQGGPHAVITAEDGVYIVAPGGVLPYPPNSSGGLSIGNPTSVAFQDGYFFFLYADGLLRATGTNTTPTNTLDFSDQSNTKCESAPGEWYRVTPSGGQIWCFGDTTIEVYSDQALTPFPYARAQVIPVGLYGKWCVAGFEPGWDGQQIFVAADRSVRQMSGYTPTRISTPEVERSIEAAAGPEVLRASAYTHGGNAIWTLSGPGFTWEYNATTQAWNERKSQGLSRWLAETSVSAFGRWFVSDIIDGSVLAVNPDSRTENGAPVIVRIESAPLRNTPDGLRLGKLVLDITTGQGSAAMRDAQCLIDYSKDGGATWVGPLARPIGGVGRYGERVTVGDLGRAGREGVRVGVTVSDPVPFSIRGADLPNVATRVGG